MRHTKSQLMRNAERFTAWYKQHKGSKLALSHDFTPVVSSNSTSLSSAAAQNVDSGLTISSESVSTNTWSAVVESPRQGCHTFEVKATLADGQIEVIEFLIEVTDP